MISPKDSARSRQENGTSGWNCSEITDFRKPVAQPGNECVLRGADGVDGGAELPSRPVQMLHKLLNSSLWTPAIIYNDLQPVGIWRSVLQDYQFQLSYVGLRSLFLVLPGALIHCVISRRLPNAASLVI